MAISVTTITRRATCACSRLNSAVAAGARPLFLDRILKTGHTGKQAVHGTIGAESAQYGKIKSYYNAKQSGATNQYATAGVHALFIGGGNTLVMTIIFREPAAVSRKMMVIISTYSRASPPIRSRETLWRPISVRALLQCS
ncbi:hypothetical protein T492DRAFT_841167 [Pavlovales sp. CCMP2436]|nr:hypothetical protein T492DRAFT_841167 [Pavlovales sp. CCMP2436]